MRSSAFALLLLLSAWAPRAARATESSDLIDCFSALKPLSREGPGQELGTFEENGTREMRHTVAVLQSRGGVEGIYLFTDAGASFADFRAVPAREKTGNVRWFSIELSAPERGIFHCSSLSMDSPEPHRSLDCGGPSSSATKFYPVKALPLGPREAGLRPLRDAVVRRIMAVHVTFAAQASAYGERLAAFRKSEQEGPGLLETLGIWRPGRPSPPSKNPAWRALELCQNTEDEYVRSAASTELSLLRSASVPQ